MKRITVLLAEDHMVVREGLRKLLEAEEDLEVVGEAQTGREAVKMTSKFRPAVVVMDIAMPLLNGLQATCQILKAVPATKVLVFSAHSDEAYVVEAIKSGAMGYLIKQTSAECVCAAIREVEKGNTFFLFIFSSGTKSTISILNHLHSLILFSAIFTGSSK
jgi:DNA-binding NarL/FixJ family response regulator